MSGPREQSQWFWSVTKWIQMGFRSDYTPSPNTLASHFHTLAILRPSSHCLGGTWHCPHVARGQTSLSNCLPAWPDESKKEADSRDPTLKHTQLFWLHMDKTLLTGWNDAWVSGAIARAWVKFSHIRNLWVGRTTRGEKTKSSPFVPSSPIKRQTCIP